MARQKKDCPIEWREWSEQSFEDAKREGKLVLLDLSASWCHWCHVMDDKTYSDPEVAQVIKERFVPIRVDIDRRPDISERYNRGGFPTTAFLSDLGESIWGATYVPPSDMKRIMEAIINAHESGEIGKALERSRIPFLDVNKRRGTATAIDLKQLDGIFEDILLVYDVEFGGFGIEPKFPHPNAIGLLLSRYLRRGGDELAGAVCNTLDHMLSGLEDKVEGGVFRYSVTRDWQTPHYEKMLETNAGFLRNLAQTHVAFGDRGYDRKARRISDYILKTLRDNVSGGLYGSQDADEEYYKLHQAGRAKKTTPSVDRTVYAGWNADASSALMQAGLALRDDAMVKAGRDALDYALRELWNPRRGLVRHVASEELYLFEDQVTFLDVLLSRLAVEMHDSMVEIAKELVREVDKSYASGEGKFNDVILRTDTIGELHTPRVSLVNNSDWALDLARLGSLLHSPELIEKARSILGSFAQSEIEAHGVFAASYLMARWALEKGIAVVEIHGDSSEDDRVKDLKSASVRLFDPSIMTVMIVEEEMSAPFAMVCTADGCSRKICHRDDLLAHLMNMIRST